MGPLARGWAGDLRFGCDRDPLQRLEVVGVPGRRAAPRCLPQGGGGRGGG